MLRRCSGKAQRNSALACKAILMYRQPVRFSLLASGTQVRWCLSKFAVVRCDCRSVSHPSLVWKGSDGRFSLHLLLRSAGLTI